MSQPRCATSLYPHAPVEGGPVRGRNSGPIPPGSKSLRLKSILLPSPEFHIELRVRDRRLGGIFHSYSQALAGNCAANLAVCRRH